MAVKLLFFAQSADWVQQKEMEIDLDAPRTVEEILKSNPVVNPLLEKRPFLRIAVNQEFSHFEKEVHDGDEVAFFPPFSGG